MKFFIKKLGCPKNDVDGDYIAGQLIDAGHTPSLNDEEADIVIVNTCGFILPAKEESIEEILYYEKLKEAGRIKKLYITGCLGQRYGPELIDEIKGIDGIFGLGKIGELTDSIGDNKSGTVDIFPDVRRELNFISGMPRYVDSRYPYEYLKIADGCDRFCSYCAIPGIRGKYRSRPIDDIIREAEFLASKGKKELILVSQEGSGYGRDFDDEINIISLLNELEKIRGIEWIRLMYLHPESVTDELIELMTHSDKILGYFDIPLQHISDRILKSMNRPVTRLKIEKILGKIRRESSKNIIRTTFIAGFPGEADMEFLELKDFVRDFEFDRLGVFQYSPEEGTKAAGFSGHVAESTAAERVDELMLLQQEIAFAKNIALIDSFQKVIIDEVNTMGPALGRTAGDCPEIDQTVFIKGVPMQPGDFKDVRIVMVEGYDLIAEAG